MSRPWWTRILYTRMLAVLFERGRRYNPEQTAAEAAFLAAVFFSIPVSATIMAALTAAFLAGWSWAMPTSFFAKGLLFIFPVFSNLILLAGIGLDEISRELSSVAEDFHKEIVRYAYCSIGAVSVAITLAGYSAYRNIAGQ